MKIINHIVATATDNILELNRPIRNIDVYIQAGAALTDKRIGQFHDNTGNNISIKNRQYCELTALYWIWKNQEADYYGLEHYRRAFDLTDSDIESILSNGVDAIIPSIILMNISVEEQYFLNTCCDSWNAMMNVLKEADPLSYEYACVLFKKNVLIPYNMGIFSDRFLNEYCSWLFPILEKVVDICGEKWDTYQSRYPGFLAERLFTLFYFMHHDKYHFHEASVTMFTVPQTIQNLSEEYIINHTIDLLNSQKSFYAYAYLKGSIPKEIIEQSPTLINLLELTNLAKEEGLKKGDVYLIRSCNTLSDYMKVHSKAFRRSNDILINVAVYTPTQSDTNSIEDIINLYNSASASFCGLPLNICTFVHDDVSELSFDSNDHMHIDINNLISAYRSNMIAAIILPEFFDKSAELLAFLSARHVDPNDIYIMRSLSDACVTSADIAALIEPYTTSL